MRPAIQDVARPLIPHRGDAILVLATVVLQAAPLMGVFVQGPDEGLLLVYPEQVLRGRIPGVDFYTLYGPTGFHVLAGLYQLLTPDILLERGVGLVYRAAFVLGCLSLFRQLGRRSALLGALVVALFFQPLVSLAFAWVGGLAFAVWGLALLSGAEPGTMPRRRSLVAGVLLGIAVGYRYEFVVLGLAALPLMKDRGTLRRASLGYAIGVLPLGVALLTHPERLRPVLTRGGASYGYPLALVGGPSLAIWILCLVALAVLATGLRRNGLRRLRASNLLTGAVLMAAPAQRLDYIHLSFAAPFVLGACTAWWTRGRPRAVVTPRVAHQLVWPSIVVLALAETVVVGGLGTVWVHHEGRRLPLQPGDARIFGAVSPQLAATAAPGARVFVGPQDLSSPTIGQIWWYHLLPEYRPDAYYLELAPGVSELSGSGLAADILEADALVQLDYSHDASVLFPLLPSGSEESNDVVRRCFRLVWKDQDAQIKTRATRDDVCRPLG